MNGRRRHLPERWHWHRFGLLEGLSKINAVQAGCCTKCFPSERCKLQRDFREAQIRILVHPCIGPTFLLLRCRQDDQAVQNHDHSAQTWLKLPVCFTEVRNHGGAFLLAVLKLACSLYVSKTRTSQVGGAGLLWDSFQKWHVSSGHVSTALAARGERSAPCVVATAIVLSRTGFRWFQAKRRSRKN